MFSIDKFAYISGLKKINPTEKFLFGIITMFLCIGLNNIFDSIAILIIMSSVTIIKGKIPFKSYMKFMTLPMTFLLIGVITIAINVIDSGQVTILSFKLFNLTLGCTKESIEISSKLFLKSLASVSCLYFITLSTPIFEILVVLKKFKLPKLFIELMGLVYRFIFVLLETANMIFISQDSRLGYSNIKIGYKSLGKLVSALFISAYKRSQDIYTAMESRGYYGEINLLDEEYPYSYKRILLMSIIEIILIIISFWRI